MLAARDPQTTARHASELLPQAEESFPLVEACYVDLHHNPELSGQELRTAQTVAEWLSRLGFETTTGVGGTGVVGVLRNGEGPTALLRGVMDALPIAEKTGLPYASIATGVDAGGQRVPVMHACGHDAHIACLLGSAELLANAVDHWNGTLIVVAQPSGETLSGGRAMLADGLYERFGRPDVVLAQQLASYPAGTLVHRSGTVFAACATLQIRIPSSGGHGAHPHTTVDPVLIAAHTVTRLQGVVARETDPNRTAVVTVGSIHAGVRGNIIPDEATLEVDVRAYDEQQLADLENAVRRIVLAEAAAAGAGVTPEIALLRRVGPSHNDPHLVAGIAGAHASYFGEPHVLHRPDPVAASEDIAEYALPGEGGPIPTVLWFLGATPQQLWEQAPGVDAFQRASAVPGTHSPYFAPDREPTLRTGVAAMTVAALHFLGSGPVPNTTGAGEIPAAPPPPVPTPPAGIAVPDAPDWAAMAAEEPAAYETTQEANMAELLGDDGDVPPPPPPPPPAGPSYAAPPPQGPPVVPPEPPAPPPQEDPPYEL